MRLALIPLFFLLVATQVVQGQQQEQKLMDRLLSPDKGKAVPEQTKSFYGGKQFNSGSNSFSIKPFYFTQLLNLKAFSTKSFDASNYWQGDMKFSTGRADTSNRFIIPGVGKSLDTKVVGVKDATETGKSYASRDYADVREFRVRGTAQGAIDAEQKKAPMTIDQVRDLLNKNK